ncbi:MAG TPA: hypothetical protein VGQ62_03280, partial [Chloroflexota bacterium]|nr:hypothetical protein [Chloroflexota bacterium]
EVLCGVFAQLLFQGVQLQSWILTVALTYSGYRQFTSFIHMCLTANPLPVVGSLGPLFLLLRIGVLQGCAASRQGVNARGQQIAGL